MNATTSSSIVQPVLHWEAEPVYERYAVAAASDIQRKLWQQGIMMSLENSKRDMADILIVQGCSQFQGQELEVLYGNQIAVRISPEVPTGGFRNLWRCVFGRDVRRLVYIGMCQAVKQLLPEELETEVELALDL